MPDDGIEAGPAGLARKALILQTVGKARDIVADYNARKVPHGDQLVDLAARINSIKPGATEAEIYEAMAAAAVMFGISVEMMFVQGFTRPLVDRLTDLFEQSAEARLIAKFAAMDREPAAA